MSPIDRNWILLGAVALVACGSGDAVQGAPVAPWTKESDCSWWLSRDDGKSLRASISRGEDGVILTLADPVFNTWSDSGQPRVELRFNKDSKRRVLTDGWVSSGGDWGMFGLHLSDDTFRVMDRATNIELLHDGALVFEQPLAQTPTQAELEACVPTPGAQSDSE